MTYDVYSETRLMVLTEERCERYEADLLAAGQLPKGSSASAEPSAHGDENGVRNSILFLSFSFIKDMFDLTG